MIFYKIFSSIFAFCLKRLTPKVLNGPHRKHERKDNERMKKAYLILLYVIAAIFAGGRWTPAEAQVKVSGSIELDSDVHDFGDIMLGSGPVSCSFTVRNVGKEPTAIYSVVTSCGCTDVEWTKSPIKPGDSGKISATYSNDEAPLPFDKNLTVYFSGMKKPVILKLRGVCHEKKLTQAEIFTERFGDVGFRTLEVKCGNILQGESRSDEFRVANLGAKPVKLEFRDASAGLSLNVSPKVIPAGGEATVSYTVKTSRERWGKNFYYAVPVVDGVESYALAGLPEGVKAGKLRIYAFTTANFNSMTEKEKSDGPRPRFETSTFSFGKMKAGRTIDAEFNFTNEGRRCFQVYKCDTDAPRYSHGTILPTAPGKKGQIRVHVDTSMLPKGETLIIVTLTTNSPLRPVINLFISGFLE